MQLVEKIRKQSSPLSKFADVSQGLIPYDKYRGHDEATIRNRIWHAAYKKDKTYRKELKGGDVDRFLVTWNGKRWISYGDWLAAPREQRFFTDERILIREITNPRILAAYSQIEYYNTPSIINVIGFREIDPLYMLGLINSKLMSFYHRETSPKSKKGLFPKILVQDVRQLPIRHLPARKQSAVGAVVTKILQAKAKDATADVSDADRMIDELVYSAYGLTEKEIAIVENAIK